MPYKSEAQRKAMHAAARGKSLLDIPRKVAMKYVKHKKKKSHNTHNTHEY